MKWLAIPNRHSILQEFRLQESGETKLILKYNPGQQSVRLNCNGFQRLYFISSAGSLSGKYIFCNEYGLESGDIHYDRWFGREGSMSFESKKYAYTITDGPTGTIAVYEDPGHKLMLNCELPFLLRPAAAADSLQHNGNFSFLMLALCWFLSQPVSKAVMAGAA